VAISGFAQKNKRKALAKTPKNTYFEILINGCNTQNDTYCPLDTIIFDFQKLDTNITIVKYCWSDNYYHINLCDSTPISLPFPIIEEYPFISSFNVNLYIEFESPSDPNPVLDTIIITTVVNIDFIRTILDTIVCQGRNITVPTATHGNILFTDVQEEINSVPWDTLQGKCCDSLVHWYINMNPYIHKEYSISSCDSIIWKDHSNGIDTIFRRLLDYQGDYTDSLSWIFKASNPELGCDTMKMLKFTIIDKKDSLEFVFDQKEFCANEDMEGVIKLNTNFTAFDWIYRANAPYNWIYQDTDSAFTAYVKEIDIIAPGYYYVLAYMDTSLYDTLKGLRIVNCSFWRDTLVADCPLIIPNIITPDDAGLNEVLGIKKLNLARENELTIYDRWGKIVFHQKNYKCLFKGNKYENEEDAFKGISRSGQKLPDGTYYYALKYDAIPKNKGKTYTGVLVIMRKR
jgi:gliding motility-associated-like protein